MLSMYSIKHLVCSKSDFQEKQFVYPKYHILQNKFVSIKCLVPLQHICFDQMSRSAKKYSIKHVVCSKSHESQKKNYRPQSHVSSKHHVWYDKKKKFEIRDEIGKTTCLIEYIDSIYENRNVWAITVNNNNN